MMIIYREQSLVYYWASIVKINFFTAIIMHIAYAVANTVNNNNVNEY